jgi:hypothetical protein
VEGGCQPPQHRGSVMLVINNPPPQSARRTLAATHFSLRICGAPDAQRDMLQIHRTPITSARAAKPGALLPALCHRQRTAAAAPVRWRGARERGSRGAPADECPARTPSPPSGRFVRCGVRGGFSRTNGSLRGTGFQDKLDSRLRRPKRQPGR